MPRPGGLANAASHPATNLSLAGEVPAGRQGLSFGVKQSAIPAATLLAGLAVPSIALTFGWRWAFAGGAALALAVAFLVPAGASGSVVRRPQEAREKDARTRPLFLLALGIGLGSAAATGITQTGASGGAAVGPLVFGLVAEVASYDAAWLVCGATALGALVAILTGRRLLLRDRRLASPGGSLDGRASHETARGDRGA